MFFKNRAVYYLLTLLWVSSVTVASPWLLPGNLAVKSDIDILADAGLIKAPVMTWPMAWVNIGPELLSQKTKAKLAKEPASVQQAYQRIVTLYKNNYQLYKPQTAIYASGSNQLNPFRTFQYAPYAKFASGISTAYQMKHFAGSLNVSYYHAPNQSYSDDAHIDNSYAYFLLGNWGFGFDQFNRWWGPGFSDAMILSQNAEPFPAFGLQRMHAVSFKTKWLHWLGPWSISSIVSENGPAYFSYPQGVDNNLYWFTNVSFRPLQSLQFDITRNVLFAGKQRPLTWRMFFNLITLQDSYEHGMSAQDAPGSEEWDIGTKWSLMPAFHMPVNFYQQTTFMNANTDDAPFPPTPDYTTFLLGGSIFSQLAMGTLRTYLEYEYNVTRMLWWMGNIMCFDPYGDPPYPYVYYNRLLGSPLGSNGIGYTLGAILTENDGNSDTAMLRFIRLNTLNNGIVGTPGFPFAKQDVVWLSFGRVIVLSHHLGSLSPEIGYLQSITSGPGLSSGLSATLAWVKKF